MLRAPFVDLLTTMTRPDLPMTAHEYGEWGDFAADPAALTAVRQIRHPWPNCIRQLLHVPNAPSKALPLPGQNDYARLPVLQQVAAWLSEAKGSSAH